MELGPSLANMEINDLLSGRIALVALYSNNSMVSHLEDFFLQLLHISVFYVLDISQDTSWESKGRVIGKVQTMATGIMRPQTYGKLNESKEVRESDNKNT